MGDYEENCKKVGFEPKGPLISEKFVETMIIDERYHVFPGTTGTFCLLELYNGFTVEGYTACADPQNFNEQIGRLYARKNALAKVWPLAGFLLRQRLWQHRGICPLGMEDLWLGSVPHEVPVHYIAAYDPVIASPEAGAPSVHPAVPVIDAMRDDNLRAQAGVSLGSMKGDGIADGEVE